MPKTTSISLGAHFEKFVKSQVKSGRYGTASEVVRAGLRALEEDEHKLAALRAAIDEGDSSGLVENFSIEDVLSEVRRKKR
ncbi:MAG: type II toxin-antitoxin system ParD family antitoxin [Myxococcaceae bacterium]|nr:type II toxin-antitoxin system ParD family antitoxin [Myxococcaceae bacterium]